jgi:hypothetical protein
MPAANLRPPIAFQELTPREANFVLRYLTHFDKRRAAREAGYNTEFDRQQADELMAREYIRNIIGLKIQELAMGADEVLARWAAVARFDVSEYLVRDETGHYYVDIEAIKRDGVGFVIKKYSVNRFGVAEVEFYSASDALDRIAKHLGVTREVPNVEVNVAFGDWARFVQEARAKREALEAEENARGENLLGPGPGEAALQPVPHQRYRDGDGPDAYIIDAIPVKNENRASVTDQLADYVDDHQGEIFPADAIQDDNEDSVA